MSDIILFEADGEAFEQAGRSNGGSYWMARDFMAMLGYENFAAFDQAVNRAIGTCTTLGIPVVENFQQCTSVVDGRPTKDYKLSRFACYLVAMNGDVKKPAVAAAQAYFATLAEAARRYVQNARDVERVQIRDEISGREKSLVSVAKNAGVEQYQFFQNAGYRGMYNMNFSDLKREKGIPDEKRSLLDFMDKRELAANLFRITETEAKLKSDQIRGQRPAELAATEVGRRVRKLMIDTDGTKPEDLPLTSDIKEVRAGLKKAAKEFVQIDGPNPGRKKLPPAQDV